MNSTTEPGFPGPVGPELTATERRVHEALAERSSVLADAYIGSIYALASGLNPYRLQQAALACRELMRAVPDYFGYDLSAFRTGVASKMRVVLNKHGAAVARSGCRIDASWDGRIDQ
ncbi:MAG: hypothetical protein WD645_03385, partial [Dehalococcoidia bacterium]